MHIVYACLRMHWAHAGILELVLAYKEAVAKESQVWKVEGKIRNGLGIKAGNQGNSWKVLNKQSAYTCRYTSGQSLTQSITLNELGIKCSLVYLQE